MLNMHAQQLGRWTLLVPCLCQSWCVEVGGREGDPRSCGDVTLAPAFAWICSHPWLKLLSRFPQLPPLSPSLPLPGPSSPLVTVLLRTMEAAEALESTAPAQRPVPVPCRVLMGHRRWTRVL